jgi:hypothetical protein
MQTRRAASWQKIFLFSLWRVVARLPGQLSRSRLRYVAGIVAGLNESE